MHTKNLSSVPELPLDSNLRPIDSLDTCWGDLPKGGVGGTFPRVRLPSTRSLLLGHFSHGIFGSYVVWG